MSILDEIYEWYTMRTGYRLGEAEKAFNEVWDRAEKVLGEEFGEELRYKIFAYMEEECSNEFQAGLRLGALLMQELQIS